MLQMLAVAMCAQMAFFLLLLPADNLLFEHVCINIPKLMSSSLWQRFLTATDPVSTSPEVRNSDAWYKQSPSLGPSIHLQGTIS
jgi:hypothetical protein